MDSRFIPLIQTIRRFNRFYTNILGLLDKHMLDSEFSLAEVRVLYDIEHTEVCTAKGLSEQLRIDPGYLSRIIKRFEKANLVFRVKSPEDGRLHYLHLTDKGKETLSRMDDLSNGHIFQMINSLPDEDQVSIVESMKTIENVLSRKPACNNEKVSIRNELKPGDVGYLIHLHGWIYAQECGYDHMFEGYVCQTFNKMLEKYNPDKDRLWFAEVNGKIIGSIAIVEHSESLAQLRWFILHPKFRGKGLGKKLLHEAIEHCKEQGYLKVFLVTTEDQKTAIKMYRSAGFRKITEHQNKMWGKNLVEQTYELTWT